MPEHSLALAQVLRLHGDRILSRFVAEVQRGDLPPPGISRSLLVDHIPRFLEEIAAELTRSDVTASAVAAGSSPTARQHGEQRWALGYDLEALIREYGVLLQCIIRTANELGVRLSHREFEVLSNCTNVGVAEAALQYVKYRDAELNAQKANLEFLAQAGQLVAESLDLRSTLSRLLGLLVPHLADWCAVHLEGDSVEDMPLAHVDPAKTETLRNIYRRYPLPSDSPYGYPFVLRTGEAQLMAEIDPALFAAAARDEEHLALLRAINSCSWMMVPLRVQGHRFGALTLAYSDSGRHYGPSDLLLAGEFASRAAVALDNARLYALSQQERSRVEAATRAKDEFVAMVSHELRTPLNAILGWLRLMRSGSLDDSTKAHAFGVIERNAEAQSQLVGDLLDISRVMRGKIRIHPSQMDLADVVERAIEGVRPAAQAKRIAIETQLERYVLMRGDSDRLQQVVWNLLVNALKFTPKEGSVSVRLARVDSDLELEVQDTGEGIPAEFLPHLFETFRQWDSSSSRQHGGLGIGLSIVKHLVELHGGAIEAHSAGTGSGARFLVRLPVSPVVSTTLGVARVPATTEPSAGEPSVAELAKVGVLVVEDEPDARELVACVLQSSGMEVRTAGSAAEALRVLDSFLPEVIVSDIGMPDEDGYSLIRTIRTHRDEQRKNIPAIALTAYARNEDRTRALVAGFNLHMSKPVEPAALVRAVAELAGHAAPGR